MQHIHSDAAIRDTITAIFRGAEYATPLLEIVRMNVMQFIYGILHALRRASRENPVIFWISLTLVVTIVVVTLVHGAYLARQRAKLSASASRMGLGEPGQHGRSDAWLLAQQQAARGNYTEAAHALYRHLLNWIAGNERVELHPAKTIGDYGRDLRARSSRLFKGYRDFARSYEVVVYGSGGCDKERYEGLLSLADAITGYRG